ncbi:hypothetical protein BDV26DRAFT_297238 [Aspergillus bertholletiae]|uniref:Uncharacterized protein n=1 Tax=Aspergillus bertholletiae TaxID=1226010 RepID=A0A5N7ATC8_9EURO|nr:hypothetical protein BDV26DRAFT_297238 [Aspergillus bertholletiae]
MKTDIDAYKATWHPSKSLIPVLIDRSTIPFDHIGLVVMHMDSITLLRSDVVDQQWPAPNADESSSGYSLYYSRKGRIDASSHLLSYPLSHNTATSPSSPMGSYYLQLQISGQGIFKNVLQQATAAICQDMIQELVEDAFPITDRDTPCQAVPNYKRLDQSLSVSWSRADLA